jgi:hypothetical protein
MPEKMQRAVHDQMSQVVKHLLALFPRFAMDQREADDEITQLR